MPTGAPATGITRRATVKSGVAISVAPEAPAYLPVPVRLGHTVRAIEQEQSATTETLLTGPPGGEEKSQVTGTGTLIPEDEPNRMQMSSEQRITFDQFRPNRIRLSKWNTTENDRQQEGLHTHGFEQGRGHDV